MEPASSLFKQKRIFIGTTEIAGYYKNLAKGLNELGANFKYVQLSPNTSGYGSQSKLPFLIRLPFLIAKYRTNISLEPGLYTVHQTKKGYVSLSRFALYAIEWFLRAFFVLPWAILSFDIFCFGARSNIVGIKAGYWDIRLLKMLGKKIIYTYHGSDSRPPYINGSILHNLLLKYPNWDEKLKKLTTKLKKSVTTVDDLADIIIDNPYSAHFHEKKFINWFSIGSPYAGFDKKNITAKSDNKYLRILHAPTHRIAKGSPVIEACIAKLKREGYLIELILLHGRPHHEVLEEICQCDFVIDELYSDVLMATFAVEAAFFAKPVIVCGYVDDIEIKETIPTYYCRPEGLENAIRTMITDSQLRKNLGVRACKFVNTEWSYLEIAKRYLRIFANDIPESWFYDPGKITYLHGFGLPEDLLKKCLASLLAKQNQSVLQLDDKPLLRDAFLKFSAS